MTERDPLVRKLAGTNPVPLDSVRGSSRSPSADRILQDVLQGRVAQPRRPHRRLAAALVGAVVGLVAVTIVALGVTQRSPATAAELLRDAAENAAAATPPPDVGRYVYTKTTSDQLTTSDEGAEPWSVVLPIEEETWIAPDGSGRIRSSIGEPRFLGPRDRERWQAAGSPAFPSGESDDTFPAGTLAYEDVASLPTDPARLRAALEEQVAADGVPTDIGVFRRIGLLLGRADAPPSLRAALYRVASELRGIESLGATTDPLGRDGVGVRMRYSDGGVSIGVVLVFDERTSRVLSQERILLSRAPWVDAAPGTRLSFTTFVSSGTRSSVETPQS